MDSSFWNWGKYRVHFTSLLHECKYSPFAAMFRKLTTILVMVGRSIDALCESLCGPWYILWNQVNSQTNNNKYNFEKKLLKNNGYYCLDICFMSAKEKGSLREVYAIVILTLAFSITRSKIDLKNLLMMQLIVAYIWLPPWLVSTTVC